MLVLSCAPHLPYLTWDSARKKSLGTLGKMPTGAPTLGDLIQRRAFGEVLNRAITLRLLPPILFRPFRGPFESVKQHERGKGFIKSLPESRGAL
jgi:hypothetical protein